MKGFGALERGSEYLLALNGGASAYPRTLQGLASTGALEHRGVNWSVGPRLIVSSGRSGWSPSPGVVSWNQPCSNLLLLNAYSPSPASSHVMHGKSNRQ